MQRIVAAILLTAWVSLSQQAAAQAPQPGVQPSAQNTSTHEKPAIIVPAGTKIGLALSSPVWAKSANAVTTIHAITSFPVAVANQMAIPPGTYVEAKIDSLTRPHWLSNHAEIQLHFTKLVFANGYAVELPDVRENLGGNGAASVGTTSVSPSVDVRAAIARIYVEVTSRNDVLLDNGAPIEMLLQTPLSLDPASVAAAVSRSKPLLFMATKSATKCVPTPPTPGLDMVLPGSPGSPDIVIPGGPGMPDTVIPGTPATPPTVVPGSPAFGGTICPGPPIVISAPIGKDVHTKTIALTKALQIGGAQLAAGKHQIRWTGLGPTAPVEIVLNKKQVIQTNARVVILGVKPSADQVVPRTNADGTISLGSLEFAGEAFALFFD